MKTAIKIIEEKIRSHTYGSSTLERAELMEKYAELLATEFAEWLQKQHFAYTSSPTDLNHKYWVRKIASIITTRNIYSTNQLYEQFMIERSRRTQNNKCVIPDVSKSVCDCEKLDLAPIKQANGLCLRCGKPYAHTVC